MAGAKRATLAGVAGLLVSAFAPTAQPAGAGQHWIVSWGAAQQRPEPANALAPEQLTDATLRQVVRLSAGGEQLRVRLSNAFGTQPLVVDAAHLALASRPGSATIDPASDRPLSFAGARQVTIPAGAEAYSDPVRLTVAAGAAVAVSIHLPAAPAQQTGHPGSRATSFIAHGEATGAADMPGAATVEHWYQLADIEVAAAPAGATVATIGDSITDGHGAGVDRDARWPDRLAERLRRDPATRGFGVLNVGIGGNRVLLDGLGSNLLARFDRDVVARSGVRWAIVMEGVNDLGVLTRDAPVAPAVHAATVAAITGGYTQLVARAHAHGIRVIGGTITPYAGSDYYHPGPASEADRQAINRFIRGSATFDAVVDFDAALRDPAHPDRLLPGYDSGDHLHPSEEGYRRMAAAVPLSLFRGGNAAATADVPPAANRDGTPTIALTFDDLPAHGPLPPGNTRLQVVDAIIAALRAERIEGVYGFVNGGFGIDDPQSPAVLAHWRAAGFPLGNHTWPHLNLNENDAATFEAQVSRNEPLLARLSGGSDWHWLRYPFLAEGDTAAKRDAVRGWLHDRGYRAAAVTMSFGDYAWNDAAAPCLAKGDTRAVAALEASYLAAARDAAVRERAMAKALYGHDIPYVLLMHLGAFDARMLPRLLAQYRAMGFGFTTLPQAEADPFYAAATDLARPGPTPTLEASMAAKGLPVPAASAAAAMPAATFCR